MHYRLHHIQNGGLFMTNGLNLLAFCVDIICLLLGIAAIVFALCQMWSFRKEMDALHKANKHMLISAFYEKMAMMNYYLARLGELTEEPILKKVVSDCWSALEAKEYVSDRERYEMSALITNVNQSFIDRYPEHKSKIIPLDVIASKWLS